jgi:hypothetical protein
MRTQQLLWLVFSLMVILMFSACCPEEPEKVEPPDELVIQQNDDNSYWVMFSKGDTTGGQWKMKLTGFDTTGCACMPKTITMEKDTTGGQEP